ncbi:MAG: type II secretion system F family protein, partial [bacterium]
IFSNLFVAMVRAAEKGGNMAQVLKQLSIYLQEQYKLEKTIKAAIMYPRFVLFFFLFVLLAIIFGLVPKFKSIFESFNAQLPLPTQILLNMSDFAKSHLIMETLLIIFVIFLFKHYKKTKAGRYLWDKLKLKIPMMGDLILKSSLSKFCRTLSVLMQSGASLAESLEIAGNTTENILFNEAFQNVKKGIMEGSSIHFNLSQNPLFPPLLVKMVSVGEKSGNLDKMLNKISEMYDAHVESKISGLSSIIEPVLMVGLGAVALIVIIALYLPIFKMSGAIQ